MVLEARPLAGGVKAIGARAEFEHLMEGRQGLVHRARRREGPVILPLAAFSAPMLGRLGDRVVMGGKSGIKDNVTVGNDVVLAGGAIVLAPVGDGQFMMGYPAQSMPDFRASQKKMRQIAVSKPGQSD